MIELRKQIKKKKPSFSRQDTHKPKIGDNWRKPKGHQSKIRLHHRGHAKSVTPGYKSPIQVRGLNPQGKKEIMIYTIKDLENIKEEVGVIARIGMKKRKEILIKAKEKKIQISNYKIDEELKKIDDKLAANKKTKEVKAKVKKDTQTKKDKKQDDLSKKIEEEDKKKIEKKEKDKILIKKEN